MPFSNYHLLTTALLIVTVLAPVHAQSDQRLIYELLDRIELLEQEVRQLRGDLEVLQYQRHQQTTQQPITPTTTPNSAISTPTPLAPNNNINTPIAPTPPIASITSPAAEPSAVQESVYNSAFNHLRSGEYEQAVSQFENFINRYPPNTLTPDAHYWLGESYYVLRRFEEAKQTFLTLGADYSNSSKLPDAMLKLGYIYSETGANTRAREMLEKLIQAYPDSVAANLGAAHLRTLR